MLHAGWNDIWTLVLARFGSEAIETRLAIGLCVAFLVLMMVEGLRASFLPVRGSAPLHAPDASEPNTEPVPKKRPAAAKFTPRAWVAPRRPKRRNTVSLHRAVRPTIRGRK